jgi:hypothetical protein
MNKHGEIVFDDNGNVIKVNGYNGNRKSFEFIELSEYYKIVNLFEKLLDANTKQNEEFRKEAQQLLNLLT